MGDIGSFVSPSLLILRSLMEQRSTTVRGAIVQDYAQQISGKQVVIKTIQNKLEVRRSTNEEYKKDK